MKYTLEIEEVGTNWSYNAVIQVEDRILALGNNFKSAKDAIEAGSKRLLELLPKEQTFNFGNGPVPAHQHSLGNGWVANTAQVDADVYVGSDACVYGNAQVSGNVQIFNYARVYDNAIIEDSAVIRDNAQVYGNAYVFGNAKVADFECVFERPCPYENVDTYVLIIHHYSEKS